MKTKFKKLMSRLFGMSRHIGRITVHLSGSLIGFPRLRYYCPACQRGVLSWLPLKRNIGYGKTKLEPGGRLCPLCHSFERTRHIAIYMNQIDILESLPRMLHFAPERGLKIMLRSILKDRYVTTDLFMRRVDRKEDITKMTFDDGSFDFIYCSNVLEHIEDDISAMSELFRILSPGGFAIIQVPIQGKETYEDIAITDPYERYKNFGQADHVRYYGEDIQNRLASVGFEVTPFYMLDVIELDAAEIKRMNLGKRELIHKCVKLKR